MKKRSRTERTCVGCGLKADKRDFVRITVGLAGEIMVDVDQMMEGRGAYLCPVLGCVKKALKKERLYRVLRVAEPPLTHCTLFELIENSYRERFFSLLRLCRKERKLMMGRGMVENGLKRGKVCFILLAKDAAPRTKRAFLDGGVQAIELWSKEEYRLALDVRPLAVLGIGGEGLATKLLSVADKLLRLERGI